MRLPRSLTATMLLACGLPLVAAEPSAEATNLSEAFTQGKFSGMLRYRFDTVDDETKPKDALASTLRTSLGFASKPLHGFSGYIELYSNEILGDDTFNWLTNPNGGNAHYSQYPNVSDPEHAGFAQMYGQYVHAPSKTSVRVGRQLFTINDEQWVTASRYRQNQNIFDAASITTSPIGNLTFEGAYIMANHDVFANTVPLDGYVANLSYSFKDIGKLSLYGVWTDYVRAANFGNSVRTLGVRLDGPYKIDQDLSLLYAFDYAMQDPDFDNPSTKDDAAIYYLLEAGVQFKAYNFRVSLTHRDGNSADHDGIKAPIGYPYPYRGETEQFVGNPADGVEIITLRGGGPVPGIDGLGFQVFYWNFSAVETDLDFGQEICGQLDYTMPFEKRWKLSGRVSQFIDADEYPEGQVLTGNEQTRIILMSTFTF